MRNLLIILFTILSLSLYSGVSYGEDKPTGERTYKEIMENMEGSVNRARVSQGIVRSIDLDTRTGIIGGHKYWFGPAFSEFPLKVYLTLYGGGALELLQPGMKVEVTYGETGAARLAAIIRQLPDDSDIDH